MEANPIMHSAGYAPAADVARLLNKAVSTIHRMVEDGRIKGARDGRHLYIKVESLVDYYAADGNDLMSEACKQLYKKH